MDSYKLARSIIGSNFKDGIIEYTQLKTGDTPEIVFMKLWLKNWFLGEEIPEEEMEDLAIRTLEWILRRELNASNGNGKTNGKI